MPFLRATCLALCVLLTGCATEMQPVGHQRIIYPNDIRHAYATPVERWAGPGDLVWLEADQAYALEFAGGTVSGRDPATGHAVTRDLTGWRALGQGGDTLYFAPPWSFAPVGSRLHKPANGVTGPPPYACARREEYWTAALTWTLGRCPTGRRSGAVPGWRWSADPFTWSEIAIRYRGQEGGRAVFVYRSRSRLDDQGSASTHELSAAPGEAVQIPKWLGGLVEVQVVGFEADRVRYRLARRLIPCEDPNGCVEESVASAPPP